MKLFVCYTLRDGFVNKPILEELDNRLRLNFKIFVDLLHNDSINIQKRIMTEVANSDVVLALETPLLKSSPWVQAELRASNVVRKRVLYCDPRQIDFVESIMFALG